MCSDVMVYPYQIYQARLAGADAIKLVSPALPEKVTIVLSILLKAIVMWTRNEKHACDPPPLDMYYSMRALALPYAIATAIISYPTPLVDMTEY